MTEPERPNSLDAAPAPSYASRPHRPCRLTGRPLCPRPGSASPAARPGGSSTTEPKTDGF